jgi:intracellular septation protein A
VRRVSGRADTPTLTRRAGLLRTVGLDVVGPLLVFQLCRRAGVPDVWALVIAGVLPVVGVVVDWLRFRSLQVLGMVVLGGLALAVTLALITDNPKAVLLQGAAVTMAFGLACLLSLMLRRPLIFYFGQALYGGQHSADGIELDQNYDHYPEARSYWRSVTTVWGLAYLGQAVARGVVTNTVSTGAALNFNRLVSWIITVSLMCWSYSWGMRLEAELSGDASPSGPSEEELE